MAVLRIVELTARRKYSLNPHCFLQASVLFIRMADVKIGYTGMNNYQTEYQTKNREEKEYGGNTSPSRQLK